MPKSDLPFDLDEAIAQIKAGKPLIRQITEAALQAEQEQHLASDDTPNRKNGTTSKTIKSGAGKFELDTPRDRAGTFEPQHERCGSWGLGIFWIIIVVSHESISHSRFIRQ